MGQKSKVKKLIKEKKEQQEAEKKTKKVIKSVMTKRDLQEELSGRKIEMIHIQQNYYKAFRSRMYLQVELNEIKKELDFAIQHNFTHKQWLGVTYPTPLLQEKFNWGIVKYREAIAYEESLESQLRKTYGFSPKELQEARAGKFRKKLPGEGSSSKNNTKETISYSG